MHNSQTQPQNSDLNFGNKLILSTSSELCHKNIMLRSQNGPLTERDFPFIYFILLTDDILSQ